MKHLSSTFFGRLLLFLYCLYTAHELVTAENPWTFISNVNLIIHEAGHFIFNPFGQVIMLLGGSFLQIIVPFMFYMYFMLREEYFSGFFAFYWVSTNLIHISVYISDAENQMLPLIAEGLIHDWNWLLTHFNILHLTDQIGIAVFVAGVIVLFVSLFGMGWMLFKPFIYFKRQV